LIADNHCWENYYDNIDGDSNYPASTAAATHHSILNNYCWNAGGDGINSDGQFNLVRGNHLYNNSHFGIFGTCDLSDISANYCYDNNTSRVSSQADIVVNSVLGGNKIHDNYVWGGAGQNNNSIYSYSPGVVNSVKNNYATGNAGQMFFGNPDAVPSIVEGNIDPTTGALTQQAFTLELSVVAAALNHKLYDGAFGTITSNFLTRITGATQSATVTPQGADASTAFSAGAKLGSANTNFLWFNTAAQFQVNGQLSASIVFNSSGTALNVQAAFSSLNINGVTLTRLLFIFTNATSGAAFSPASLSGSQVIRVQFQGRLS
jgi:hypothetical protein